MIINPKSEHIREIHEKWLKLSNSSSQFMKSSIFENMEELRDIINNKLNIEIPFNYILLLDEVDILLDIKYSKDGLYHCDINWNDIFKDVYKILIYVPIDYDREYIISMIISELRYMFSILDVNSDLGLYSFVDNLNFSEHKDYNEFSKLFYIALEYELLKKMDRVYSYIRFDNMGDSKSLSILKLSFIWKALDSLTNFNVENFIMKFNLDNLINLTNVFIEKTLFNKFDPIKESGELIYFYESLSVYFKNISIEWRESLLSNQIDYRINLYTVNEHSCYGYKLKIDSMCSEIFRG